MFYKAILTVNNDKYVGHGGNDHDAIQRAIKKCNTLSEHNLYDVKIAVYHEYQFHDELAYVTTLGQYIFDTE